MASWKISLLEACGAREAPISFRLYSPFFGRCIKGASCASCASFSRFWRVFWPSGLGHLLRNLL